MLLFKSKNKTKENQNATRFYLFFDLEFVSWGCHTQTSLLWKKEKKKKESGVNGVSSTLNKSSIRIVGILQPNFYDKQNGMPWVFGRIAREHGPDSS